MFVNSRGCTWIHSFEAWPLLRMPGIFLESCLRNRKSENPEKAKRNAHHDHCATTNFGKHMSLLLTYSPKFAVTICIFG